MRVKGSGKTVKQQLEKHKQLLEAKQAKIKQLQALVAACTVDMGTEALKEADKFYALAQKDARKAIVGELFKLSDEQLKTVKD